MLAQAERLLRSIRWFGGELAKARIVVCGVGAMESNARRTLEELGAEIRIVSRFHPANPTGNRLQLIAELLDAPQELLLLLDCDTIVVQDPLPYLRSDVLQGKIAPAATVTDDVFERLFAHFGLTKPPRTHVTRFTGETTIPYVNVGVLAVPTAMARTLEASWRRFNLAIAERPELAAPCERHMHQASFALALVESGIALTELPDILNFQINATHLKTPPGYDSADPVIIHYHHLTADDGLLLPAPYPGAQKRIALFNERMTPRTQTATPAESRPVVVLGMHRSGTSLVAEVMNVLGAHAGRSEDLGAPDLYNPTGYWEHRDVVKLDSEILDAVSATWSENSVNVDLSRLTSAQRAEFAGRARRIAQSLHGRGAFVLKDPRMSLLFPLWREALGEPVCVIVWREPLAVARSLLTRNKQPLLMSLALWEHYNRTLLRDTEGLQRVLVSYEQLLADPVRVTGELHAALARFGVEGLSVPTADRIAQTVQKDFNRSGPSATIDETLLTPEQLALRDDLRSGDALAHTVAPPSPRAMELLAELSAFETLRREVAELDSLLHSVFTSRSWQIGHRATALVRVLRREKALSARDRWEASKHRRNAALSGTRGNGAAAEGAPAARAPQATPPSGRRTPAETSSGETPRSMPEPPAAANPDSPRNAQSHGRWTPAADPPK